MNSKTLWIFTLAALTCGTASLVAAAHVDAVGAITLSVASLDREVEFYTHVLPFHRVDADPSRKEKMDTDVGLDGAQTRSAELQLGAERISLLEFTSPRGRPIPTDSQSNDLWFQHIAIVVRDMDAAYTVLAKHHVKHVSTAPQTLPAWNRGAAGIKAFYFRDPEDHVVEIIWFPPGKGDPKWQQPTEALFLGIDHTAIVVSDTEKSLAFYRDGLGLRIAGESENYGVEQEHLNQMFGARLRITALRAAHGPGIEFLEYIAPPGGRPLPADAAVNDLIAWRVELDSSAAAELSAAAVQRGGRSAGGALVRDPDGHLLWLKR